MQLIFPVTGGGEEQGLNDAGVETFEGEVGNYLARECAQNVGDSAGKGVETVEITFDLIDMPISDLPCLSDTKNVFQKCKEYWVDDKDAQLFFDRALSYFKSTTIPVLKVSDYGTTGLTGKDHDRHDKWYALVRAKGVSVKSGSDAAGSFGIGKFAPFAASAFRTIYYSTLTEEGNHAFQGVMRVASHKNGDKLVTQGTGYIGDYVPDKSEFKSVRESTLIPENLRRTKVGTDIYVPAYRSVDQWERDLLFSILNNFWPAVHLRKIKFRVGEHSVDRESLSRWIEKFSGEEGFRATCYYRALTDNGARLFEQSLGKIGLCRLHLVLGDGEDRKEVAMIRQNGMIIDYWRFQAVKPFSGLFICDNKDGSTLLRKMEPPRHDKFDPARLPGGGTEIVNTMRGWIRECIKTLMPQATGTRFELNDVARFLPDEEDLDEADLSGETTDPKESLNRIPDETKAKSVITIPVLQTTNKGEYDSGEDIEGKGGNEPGPGSKGDGKNTGGKKKLWGLKKDKNGSMGNERGDVKCRAVYLSDSSYRLVIRSEKKFSGNISLQAVGDDGGVDSVVVKNITGDKEVSVKKGLLSLKLSPNQSASVAVQIDLAGRLSLRGVAHEG